MGFLNKAFRKVKKQIQPGNMIARDMGPGNMPKRPDIFGRDSFLFGRKPDMTSIRMPQKRGGGMGGLGEAIRRLQEQRGGDMGMPRRPSMPGMGSPGGTPGFYDNMRENMSPGQRLEQRPNFGMEQMPTARRDPSALERLPMGGAPSFNPTIFGQQIGDMDFSQMPEISPVDMSNLQMPTLPREISQMDLPQMPEGLPSMQDVQGMPQMGMRGMRDMQPRQMFGAGGLAKFGKGLVDNILPGGRGLRGNNQNQLDKILNPPIPQAVPIPGRLGTALTDRLRRGAEDAIIVGGVGGGSIAADATQGFTERAKMQNMMLSSPEQFGKDMARMKIGLDKVIELASQKAREIGAIPGEYVGRAKQSYEQEMEAERMQQIDSQEGLQNVSLLFNQGGEAMKGYENGGEIEAMLGGMDSGEQEAMGELEQAAPEMEMIDQLVNMVVQMIQQGAGEQEVIGFLREQGLDDEDIGTILQLVAEMSETEEMAEDEIGNQLSELG